MVTAGLALFALAAASGTVPDGPEKGCRSALVADSVRPARRPVTPLDLARLRDFGRQSTAVGGEPPFSVSPDGRQAALVLRRGDPAGDSYCIGVVVVPLDGRGRARLVDSGGGLILHLSDVRGIPDLPVGNAEPVTPAWSSDGRRLAYLRRDGGRTRVWLARSDGSGARPLSRLELDARGVRWSGDGRSLLVTVRPGKAGGEAAIASEEREGFLYDRRFWTLSLSRPRPPAADPVERRIDASTGDPIEGGPPVAGDAGRPDGALAFARSPTGALAWTAARDPRVVMGPAGLTVERGGRAIACRSSDCLDGVGALWWGSDDELYVLRGATPDNGGITRLLRWRVGREEAPRPVLSTPDALLGCQSVGATIVCARETATRPRHLVRINPRTGAVTLLYDPNPEFAALELGTVRRLRWPAEEGAAAYGDLVLPPGHRPGMRHPLIVVQYQSRGFLRGGTGDDYPIHAFAARGFAVLSIERTRPVAAGLATSELEFLRRNGKGFAERWRVHRSLEAGVRRAIALGVVDRNRIGITGLSDGAATAQFALVNSDLFRAAALSSCCDEPSTSLFAAGPGYAEQVIAAGFPPPGSHGSEFWRHYSLAANASRVRTPILLQLTDDEFRFALETYGTLSGRGAPIEMHVFADEYHQKWRPAHRLATYERAIDWFDFWLNGRTGLAGKEEQYARWRALQRRQER